ncbi:MAG: helix-turn-helix domain-containing protein, partial [Dehalococcoidia bacterium]|nr:helix-turn-helix domain-containing protein [Dehalococcoidia bacterium]
MALVNNGLKEARTNAGLSQAEMAERAHISRQAYMAIEAERAVPSTQVALMLARALHTRVEELFALADEPRKTVEAELAGQAVMPPPGARVRVMQVGGRMLAKPLVSGIGTLHTLAQADGVSLIPGKKRRVSVRLFDQPSVDAPALVMAGCDPSVSLLAPALLMHGVRLLWTEEGSQAALQSLAHDEAHVAGCHLWDSATGQYNVPWVKRLVPFACTVVSFAVWQQGLILARGNPKHVQQIEDVARAGMTI